MRRLAPIGLCVFIVGAFLVGRAARAEMGIEYSPESVRAYVAGLGIKAPLIYLAMVSFRQFLFLPSIVVLTGGGLVFGASIGGALGALGILMSAAFGFCSTRWLGRDWVQRYLGAKFREFEQRMDRVGLAFVGLMTAHPMGVMTPFHWGAGLTAIPLLPFLAVIAVTALVRAFAYAFFGATFLEPGGRVYVAMAVLGVVALAPLIHPEVRRLILRPRGEESPTDGDAG
jgi:uncharacterized membrane protein YdjX (TVP38/TMEM64 family)